MEVAFLIMAYKYPSQLARLIDRLHSSLPSASILVHIDRRVDIEPFRRACLPIARFVDDRVRVHWGELSVVQANLRLASAALTGAATARSSSASSAIQCVHSPSLSRI